MSKSLYKFSITHCLKLLIGLFICITVFSCREGMPSEINRDYADLPETIDFNIHVRPILSDKCFACHGPDKNARKANLRLDDPASAKASLVSGNGKAIVSGKPGSSELISRIFNPDPEIKMPPPESNLILSAKEKSILYKWIEQKATFQEHWAFLPPQKHTIPEVQHPEKSENFIDPFIQSKASESGLELNKKEGKERLIRRVTMDLTGLPPSIDEIDQFLTDDSSQAYEKVVDRLLSAKAYGERMAMEWMDLSRYADSHGLHADGARNMWPWRDWVINAFNDNLPYDEFVTWQIAGDLIKDATVDQKLATAFNRNHTMTAEGGAIDEEFRLSYVYDRTETFSTAFLGLTVGCARCHDHKFDPLSQKEYYEMAAFFNNVKELGMTGDDGDYGPMLSLLTADQKVKLADIDRRLLASREDIRTSSEELSNLEEFIHKLPKVEPLKDRVFYGPMDFVNSKKWIDRNKNFTARADNDMVEGKKGMAFRFTGEYDELYINNLKSFDAYEEYSASLWINTTKKDSTQTQTLLGTTGSKNNFWRGWEFYLDGDNRLNMRLIHSLPHNYLHVRTTEAISINQWTHVGFTYDGTGIAGGVSMYINGKKKLQENLYNKLYKSASPVKIAVHEPEPKRPIRVAKSYRDFTGENGVFLGQIDEIKLYKRALTPYEMHLSADSESSEEFNIGNESIILRHPEITQKRQKLQSLIKERIEFYEGVREIMVMEEMPSARKAFMYNRGEYTQPTEEVNMATPGILPDLNDQYPVNRLGLAQWLFDTDHPLTARVTVNRYWQLIFGRGLVDTPGDFGLQGSLPSHPKLLDYLAISFMEQDWDLKWLIKTMVMSHTYRQSSKIDEALLHQDPENILLARAPSYRLPAEMIRDNALVASGLYVSTSGGESVKPYQPEGLWIEKSSFSHQLLRYKENSGDSLYRRSLYTFIRRTSPPPSMTIFDQPSREICVVKREKTNTPLQALVLLNDPQFVEAARVMAERVLVEGGESIDDKINYACRLTLGRRPTEEENNLLVELYESRRKEFLKDQKSALALRTSGEKSIYPGLKRSETAALAMVTSTLLNHNESYIKR